MVYVPWGLDLSYEFIENCFFWQSMEKTLFTLNVLLVIAFALLLNALIGGIPAIALRFAIVLCLWAPVCYHSPIFMTNLLYFINFVKPHVLSLYERYLQFDNTLQKSKTHVKNGKNDNFYSLFDPNSKDFNMKNFQRLMREVIKMSKTNQMQIEPYCLVYCQVLNLLKYVGSISLAFQDIRDKADKIEENRKILGDLSGIDFQTIEQMLDFEFEHDLAFLDGNNYKKVNKPHYKMTN